MNEEQSIPKESRPPIVVVMGHIDHGKTSILDYYRAAKVAGKESGGITQHIGAYEVEHHGKNITFIDTPGHEAFSKIRSRGARVADLAILVIAADEGVKPQTKEALDIIRNASLPFVIAFNKIDRPEANPERVKQDLAREEILVESYGGQIPSVAVSAKTGQGMDELLEVLLILADLAQLHAHPERPAQGVIIETHRDPRRGIAATLLILDGTLFKKDVLALGRNIETMRIFENFQGSGLDTAGPSVPVRAVGIAKLPFVGDTFRAFRTRDAAETFVANLAPEIPSEKQTSIPSSEQQEKKLTFNIILKADVAGSQEALADALEKIGSDMIRINILLGGVGDINESDVKHAQATNLVTIVGFRVKIDPAVQELAAHAHIRLVMGDVIYDIIEKVKKEVEELLPPEIKRTDLGKIKILKIFKRDGARQIVGARVETGAAKKGMRIDLYRVKERIGTGVILQLQREKTPVEEVQAGTESGLMIELKTPIEIGDTGDIFEENTIKRTL